MGSKSSKTSKIIALVVVLTGFSFWLFKVTNFVETEQKNDRIVINNAVVRIVNDIQSKVQAPEALFEQFLRLDELDESKQRGTWALLDLMDYDNEKDINAAKSELAEVFSDKDQEDQALLIPTEKLIDSYSGYAKVYAEISQAIKSKNLSNAELEALLAERYQRLALMSEEAMNELKRIQQDYIKGQ